MTASVATSVACALRSAAATAASSRRSSHANAAYHASERTGSTSAAVSAHMCLTAWNEAITRSNCFRSIAYRTAMSSARCEEPTLVAAEFGGLCYYCHAFPGVPTWRQLSARFALVAAFRAAQGAAALSERRRGKEAYSEEPLPGFELAV